ncbi:phytanoyl-CoA dioxygenase family protein [Hymenobacter cheonanensis]|uniref:phytanoyl-CoA dioxygenase family protein n=1 Tax=Hymenobacter sp. CA2-7 TaxID=3063993 RepID=UPI002712F461|nr:phytanoyl-CoA dioxygenase family protein [Hymenobacter sp. CA2-7]MDO7887627.1 phytanoyl-CoA dioxygenase family protein [Hymenobacter sp. CA2-7]
MKKQAVLVSSEETGQLGVRHLKRFWAQALAKRQGILTEPAAHDWRFNNLLLNGLGLPLQETMRHLMQAAPTFEEFEQWVVAKNNGQIAPLRIERLNSVFAGKPYNEQLAEQLRQIEASPNVLSEQDLSCWQENGYVILRGAITKEQAQATEAAVWEALEMQPDKPASWYEKPIGQGIMMDFYHHPTLRANRQSARIHKAFAQLWGTADLWATTDRTSLNPPETATYCHQGTPLHWDMSLRPPFYFGTQGLIYLCDTPAEQGAFQCVPGFHRRLESWLAGLPTGTSPRSIDLTGLAQPIAAEAGDMVIWHHFLPHGSSANRSSYPRIVQYLNMYPMEFKENVEWL